MNRRVWSQVVLRRGVLQLSHPDGRHATHRFDPEMYETVATLKWSENPNGYAVAWLPGTGKIHLHWVALGLGPGRGRGAQVDHINGDRRDSRRANLREATHRENQRNKLILSAPGSGIHLSRNGWQVKVMFKGSRVFCPSFADLRAARACESAFAAIATACDAGERQLPTRAELKTISDTIRHAKGEL